MVDQTCCEMAHEARRYNCVAWDLGTWVHKASITGLVSMHAVASQFWCTYGVISAYLMVQEGLACLSLWRSWMLAIVYCGMLSPKFGRFSATIVRLSFMRFLSDVWLEWSQHGQAMEGHWGRRKGARKWNSGPEILGISQNHLDRSALNNHLRIKLPQHIYTSLWLTMLLCITLLIGLVGYVCHSLNMKICEERVTWMQ